MTMIVFDAYNQPVTISTGDEQYLLADNVPLSAGASTGWITVQFGNYYFFDATFTGTSPSLKLQRLGADGTTVIDGPTRAAPGSGDPVGIPSGSQVRVFNNGANALTAVSAKLR